MVQAANGASKWCEKMDAQLETNGMCKIAPSYTGYFPLKTCRNGSSLSQYSPWRPHYAKCYVEMLSEFSSGAASQYLQLEGVAPILSPIRLSALHRHCGTSNYSTSRFKDTQSFKSINSSAIRTDVRSSLLPTFNRHSSTLGRSSISRKK